MKFAGVMLGSDQPKVLGEFYTKILGKPDWEQGDWYAFWKDGSGIVIGSHSEVKGQNDCPARMMISLNSKDVKKDFKRLVELGAKEVAKPYQPDMDESGDGWLATVADPDGNYIQISTPWED